MFVKYLLIFQKRVPMLGGCSMSVFDLVVANCCNVTLSLFVSAKENKGDI